MKLNAKNKAVLFFVLRVGFSAALLFYLFRKIDLEKTVAVLKSSDPTYIFWAAVVFWIINFLILLRWWIFVRALDLKVPFRKVTRYFFIGLFGNLFLPSAVGGDIIKILGLCKNSSQKPKVVGSVVIDRLSGFGGIVLLATMSFAFAYKMIEHKAIAYSIIGLALLSAVVATVLFNERIYSFCCRVFSWMPKIKSGLMKMHYDIALLKGDRKPLYQGVLISAVCQMTLGFVFFLIAKALHQEIIIIYFFIFVPLICVASLMPSIGGLGVREAGAAYLFTKIGVDSGVAVSISLINFLFMVMVGLVGGIIYVATISPRRIQHHLPDAGAGPQNA